jgi:hypothetical protein
MENLEDIHIGWLSNVVDNLRDTQADDRFDPLA